MVGWLSIRRPLPNEGRLFCCLRAVLGRVVHKKGNDSQADQESVTVGEKKAEAKKAIEPR